MRSYHFEVRETIVRKAEVEAEGAAEARSKLEAWAASRGAEIDGIGLDDYQSAGFTFRSIRSPWEQEA